MTNVIYSPTLAKVEELGKNSASFTIEPLQAGYGNTLGNSMRRVLLSSIQGSAIVSFKIHGATHEFTTVKGIKEDVVDISLNLKNVRVKSHSDEPVEVTLRKSGQGEVTAADIESNADIEVITPDQVICTIDDPNGSVEIDLVIATGRGYQTIEESSENRIHSDHIALDAVYSPVMRVRYKVDSTRVGDIMNLESLDVIIDTDGEISPREAFEEAAAILVSQYQALSGNTVVEAKEITSAKADETTAELETSIEDLDLTARTANALINNDIRTVQDLASLTEQDLKELKGFGTKAYNEVKDKLSELEL